MTNPYAPPQAMVVDVIDPQASTVLADRGTRLVAVILDSIIFGALFYVPMFVMLASGSGPNRVALGALGMFVGLGVWAWLTIRYLVANGQSVGKKITGIKITRRDGSRASLARIFWLRNVVNGLLSLIPFYGIIDGLFIFAESRECLHDKIADTIVIVA